MDSSFFMQQYLAERKAKLLERRREGEVLAREVEDLKAQCLARKISIPLPVVAPSGRPFRNSDEEKKAETRRRREERAREEAMKKAAEQQAAEQQAAEQQESERQRLAEERGRAFVDAQAEAMMQRAMRDGDPTRPFEQGERWADEPDETRPYEPTADAQERKTPSESVMKSLAGKAPIPHRPRKTETATRDKNKSCLQLWVYGGCPKAEHDCPHSHSQVNIASLEPHWTKQWNVGLLPWRTQVAAAKKTLRPVFLQAVFAHGKPAAPEVDVAAKAKIAEDRKNAPESSLVIGKKAEKDVVQSDEEKLAAYRGFFDEFWERRYGDAPQRLTTRRATAADGWGPSMGEVSIAEQEWLKANGMEWMLASKPADDPGH